MDPKNNEESQATPSADPIDPWAQAFAALESKSEETDQAASDAGAGPDVGGSAENSNQPDGQGTVANEGGDSPANEDAVGGLDTPDGVDGQAGGNAFENMLGVDDQYIENFRNDIGERVRNQAIDEVAREFINRGIRNTNGVLGATLDDPDICKRDSDGVPRFYNPETGREFTGDNPRRQAQEWVDDYNKELARAFNNTCAQYEDHLMEEQAPAIAVVEFAPKYEKLDEIRKGMFDSVIEDYEVYNSNNELIGYSCDLDKALAMVERQIALIQNYAKNHMAPQQQQQENKPPVQTGPALDMKTSSGAMQGGSLEQLNSLEAAMERVQDKILEDFRKNH